MDGRETVTDDSVSAREATAPDDRERESTEFARSRRGPILLVDMDAFFASVEQAHHPHLRGRPVIVCGDPSRRGVVTAASYEARPFGVHAGMPLQEARRLCPHAEYVEGNPEAYVALSLKLLDLYTRMTPDVEPFSVDEAFLQLGKRVSSLEAATAVARTLQDEIQERFNLGASIGVGPNKLVAKMAAGVQKPRCLTALDESGFRDTFWPRPVQEMWGVGPQLATRMRSLGITTVGELARAPVHLLKAAFGIIGAQLREAAHGHDDTPLVPYHQGVDPKSMGHEVTLSEDCADRDRLEGTLLRLCDQVARRLRSEGFLGRVVSVRLRDTKFVTRIRQRALSSYTHEAERIYEVAKTLFHENWSHEPLRLVGVTVASLVAQRGDSQPDLFDFGERAGRLQSALDQVRDRLGEASVVPAATLRHRRSMGHVPFGAISAITVKSPSSRKNAKGSTRPRRVDHDG
jgi:DNA polymerase-4